MQINNLHRTECGSRQEQADGGPDDIFSDESFEDFTPKLTGGVVVGILALGMNLGGLIFLLVAHFKN